MRPVHGGAGSCLLLVVCPTEEMCGEEAATAHWLSEGGEQRGSCGRRGDVSGGASQTAGESNGGGKASSATLCREQE